MVLAQASRDQTWPRSSTTLPLATQPCLFSQSVDAQSHLARAIGSESQGDVARTRAKHDHSTSFHILPLGPPDLNEAAITTFSVLGLFSSQAAGILSTLLAAEVIPTTVR